MVEGTVAHAALGGVVDKFDGLAPGYSAHDYASPERYCARRAARAIALGPALPSSGSVLDLGCGDGNMAGPLVGRGLAYHGVDASPAMVAEARRCVPHARARFEVADFERYEPEEPVDMTLCLRAMLYARDRPAFFRRVLGYTRTKLVFDFNPRAQRRADVERDLAAAGFSEVVFEPFLLPQLVSLPAVLRLPLQGLEHVPPAAALALRVRGIWFCAAS
jgi:SAM-dependent methyltransferase